MNTRVLLADTHTIVRQGLCSLLEKQDEIQVVGEAGDGQTLIRLTHELLPDIIIIDIAIRDMDGIEAIRQIIGNNTGCRVLVLTAFMDSNLVNGVLKAGASGCLLLDCEFEELIKAINFAMERRTYLSSSVSEIVAKDHIRLMDRSNSFSSKAITNREREVLQLLAEGKTTKEIGSQLQLSIKTVETHRQNIMAKLNIRSVAGLVRYSLREGLSSL